MSNTELVNKVREYYISNNIEIPSKVSEYIEHFPPGLSRQVLDKKYGLKTSELLELLNPKYHKADAKRCLLGACNRLGYYLASPIKENYRSKDRVDIVCTVCGHTNNTTLDSLRGSSRGCVKCKSGNLAWNKREEELKQLLLLQFDAERISNIPDNQTGYLTVKHKKCGTEYTSQLLGFVNPSTALRATCPNCRSSDRRVTNEDGITFGSQFELDCYVVLRPLNPEIHVKYSDYFNTDRRWVCDFKISDIWIEVSNFKKDFKNYFANIEDKQALVETNGHNFFFVRSLKELEELFSIMK